jgi:hypothetical protein
MAGNDQNKNRARIANDIADAILEDLGAVGANSPAGKAINEARAFSRALHETFDQGAVGRILKRTIDGDETIAPETALARTVGRGGAAAVADDAGLRRATPEAAEEVSEYLRGRFVDGAFNADGTFSPRRAQEWMRSNRELLAQYPTLRQEFGRALQSRQSADAFAARAEARVKAVEASSATSRFSSGQEADALSSILSADNPIRAARLVANAAAKDQSGRALAGVKGSFSDFLIGKAGTPEGLSGPKLVALLGDPRLASAMRQVFSDDEFKRLQWVARELAKVDGKAQDVGALMDSPANKLVDYAVRIVAARTGGQMGGGTMGGSLQTANIVTNRAREMLRGLTNDKARQLLMDAIEDPKLYRMLLMDPRSIVTQADARNTFARYIAGGASAGMTDEE